MVEIDGPTRHRPPFIRRSDVHWIESHSIFTVAGIVFCICYIVVAIIFAATLMLTRSLIAERLKAISPVTLIPLAIILGLLIDFLAGRVRENVGRGIAYIGQDASAPNKVVLFANDLPAEGRTKVRIATAQHVDFVLNQDWPAMANGPADQRSEPAGPSNGALSFAPTQSDQSHSQRRAVAVEQAFEVKRNRIRLSQAEFATLQWVVIFILAF